MASHPHFGSFFLFICFLSAFYSADIYCSPDVNIFINGEHKQRQNGSLQYMGFYQSIHIYIYMFQHSAKSLAYGCFCLGGLIHRKPFKDMTAKPITSVGENRTATTPGTTSPTLME